MNGTDREAGSGAETGAEAAVSSADAASAAVQENAPELPAPAVARVPPVLLLLLLGMGLVIVVTVMVRAHIQSAAAPAEFQDLGAGISNATGLRGSLRARWQDNTAQYQLKIEPIDPLESAGFSYVAAHPAEPLFLHMKLLDASGFAVCGKDVLFPFDPASPGEKDRERGQDMLQSAVGDDGKVMAMSAQGTLPCTAAQYKQIVYWDFTTNFPTLEAQEALMKQTGRVKVRQEARKRVALRRRRAPRSAFYTEGDDRVTGYDAQRGLLETGLGRSFVVSGAAAQAAAGAWAANSVLFHYKCDQRSRCVLSHAGGTDALTVMAVQ